jgi:hypothetical protein
MYYDYEAENEKAREFVKKLSQNLKPEDAVLVDALKESAQHASGEHYTFSSLVPEDLRSKLEPITRDLDELDSTLLLNEPELYHLTVFWCPMDKNVEELITLFKEAVQNEPLSFDLRGLIAAPFGISLKAYPCNNVFFALREKLYAATGTPIPTNEDGSYHERAVTTWITLGRYTQPPSQKVLDYINARLDEDFGVYTPDSIGVYISDNKFLRDPQLIEQIKNG